jgi:chromosome partitioning protein
MYDGNNKLAKDIRREVQKNFPEYVFKTVIPRDIKLAEAPAFGKTILQHDFNSDGAKAYLQLAKEIIDLENQ